MISAGESVQFSGLLQLTWEYGRISVPWEFEMTTSKKKMLAAGTLMGVVIGLMIALFITIRPELFR